MITRRRFLLDTSVGFAMALLPLGGAGVIRAWTPKTMALDDLSFAALAEQLNTRFKVYAAPDACVEVELIEAALAPEAVWPGETGGSEPVRYERFSLVFAGPRERRLEQKIYAFEHDRIGRFELFIVPILSRDQTRIHYQAVFNRPSKGTPSTA